MWRHKLHTVFQLGISAKPGKQENPCLAGGADGIGREVGQE